MRVDTLTNDNKFCIIFQMQKQLYNPVFSTGSDIDFREHGFVQGFYNFEKGGSIPIHVGS